jgi:hypothetical protein
MELFRHDYIVAGGIPYSWGSDEMIRGERTDRASCNLVCDDDAFDKYVARAVDKVGNPTYFVGAVAGSTFELIGFRNCQTWTDEVLWWAREMYLAEEECPKCFK